MSDLVNWGLLVSDGVAPETAAEETIIAMTSDNSEIQDSVRRVVQMIFGTTLSNIKSEPVQNRQVSIPFNQQSQRVAEDQSDTKDRLVAEPQVATTEEVVAEQMQPRPKQLNIRSMFSDDSEFSREEF